MGCRKDAISKSCRYRKIARRMAERDTMLALRPYGMNHEDILGARSTTNFLIRITT